MLDFFDMYFTFSGILFLTLTRQRRGVAAAVYPVNE